MPCATAWASTIPAARLHGALLDAGLLAEVYIQMTRGQESLVIEAEDGGAQELEVERIDLSQFQLPVLLASEAEGAEHEAVLAQLDKSSGGKTFFRNLVP
jgi:DNA polymerase-3 subunit epsilon